MFDLISVVYRLELPLLQIQAQSIARYVQHSDVNAIIVIVNDSPDLVDLIDVSWWGQHSDRVVVKHYTEFGYTSRVSGWENQQLCKLLASAESTSKWSMSLDAKTWFVNPLDVAAMFDSQGRPRTGKGNISPYFVAAQKFVEDYYQVDMPAVIGPVGPPFMFHNESVRAMIADFADFPDFFQTHVRDPDFVTEYYLYSGYILSKYQTYSTLYSEELGQSYMHYYISDTDAEEFDRALTTAEQAAGLTVHRTNRLTFVSLPSRSYPLLTPEQFNSWVKFLEKRQITETHNLLNTYIK